MVAKFGGWWLYAEVNRPAVYTIARCLFGGGAGGCAEMLWRRKIVSVDEVGCRFRILSAVGACVLALKSVLVRPKFPMLPRKGS